MDIREIRATDWAQVWPIVRDIVETAETFAYDPSALAWAKERGYAGMQFNAVAESNHPAVGLYKQLGFTVIGTVPGAFAHPTMGYVGLHVMYCAF